MSASSTDDKAMTPSSSVASDVNRVLRLNGARGNNSRYFGFPWKQPKSDDKANAKNKSENDVGNENFSNSKISNGFLKNIKKRLRIKNIGLCKAKQKIKAIDSQRPTEEVAQGSTLEDGPLPFAGNRNPVDRNSRVASAESGLSSSNNEVDRVSGTREADACWESYLALGYEREEGKSPSRDGETGRELRLGRSEENDLTDGREGREEEDASVVKAGNIAEPQSTRARESVEAADSIDAQLSNDCKAKVNLSEELLKLSKYGWYWGPISGDEADSKLVSEPDGAFLVRDSSDDRYLLTLSFKSSGRLLHARMEHSGGLFSLCNQGDNEGFTSVAALIDHSMNSSQSAVFCYSRPRYPGYPSFPVRLTKPVSRFTQVRSLQYLCRFVIRQNTRLDNIHKLPLPKTIRGYIEEAHY